MHGFPEINVPGLFCTKRVDKVSRSKFKVLGKNLEVVAVEAVGYIRNGKDAVEMIQTGTPCEGIGSTPLPSAPEKGSKLTLLRFREASAATAAEIHHWLLLGGGPFHGWPQLARTP